MARPAFKIESPEHYEACMNILSRKTPMCWKSGDNPLSRKEYSEVAKLIIKGVEDPLQLIMCRGERAKDVEIIDFKKFLEICSKKVDLI